LTQLIHPPEAPARDDRRVAKHAPRAGDTTATLYSQHHHRIHAYCLGQLRDRTEADDAVQSTFLYAFALLQRGVRPRTELPWLYTIAHNVCRTRRRSLKRRMKLESAVDLHTLHDTLGRDDPAHEELDRLGTSLAELPETQRQAFLLREWRGLSYSEIALRLDLTESAVEALLFRARRNLARKLRRTTERAASLSSVVFVFGRLRRLGPLAAGKAAAAAVVVGVAAGTALQAPTHPLQHGHGPAGNSPAAQRSFAPRHRGRTPTPKPLHAPRLTAAQHSPAAAETRKPEQESSGPAQPLSTSPATTSSVEQGRPETGSEKPATPPTGSDPLPVNPLPSSLPALPPAVEDVVTGVEAVLPPSPDVQSMLPPEVADVIPTVATPSAAPPPPTLHTPSLPPKDTLLQDRP
jgi:RNA polymerase sigma factor (sigma-70 family)